MSVQEPPFHSALITFCGFGLQEIALCLRAKIDRCRLEGIAVISKYPEAVIFFRPGQKTCAECSAHAICRCRICGGLFTRISSSRKHFTGFLFVSAVEAEPSL